MLSSLSLEIRRLNFALFICLKEYQSRKKEYSLLKGSQVSNYYQVKHQNQEFKNTCYWHNFEIDKICNDGQVEAGQKSLFLIYSLLFKTKLFDHHGQAI